MTTIVKAADAAQFLSLVPRMLGYLPRRSVVVVPMGGARSLGAMRIDLPESSDEVDAGEPAGCDRVADEGATLDCLAATIIGMVCRVTGADGFASVVYTDRCGGTCLPHAALATALRRAADASGLRVVEQLMVGANGWGSYLDPVPRLSSLSDLVTLPSVAGWGRSPGATDAGPATLDPVTGDQTTGSELPRYTSGERRAVDDAHVSLAAALEVLCGIPSGTERGTRVDPAALEAACLLDDLPALFERALRWDPATLTPSSAAVIGWCLARPALRDVAVVQWASDIAGGEIAMEAQRRWEGGEEYPAELAAILWGEGIRPDPDRLLRARELCRHVAALSFDGRRVGALAVCAWLSWALGGSTHAGLYADAALSLDADHGLADIVRSFVATTHLPDWAFRRGGVG
ncbi:DUF4192 family protein [Microbacterium sp. TNHR37B]|uniref:DUF4192 family protein n=1 Tax=Microbacterium sp. TNHR37B TaxID=1775956 RepID=UPI0007B1C059|nr:DUF4192 family protein [Microbacterium sp. TNHR37B]KZE89450.1 hypothetical protein AVP41_02245 [Microbacterium sp. TNHR37B]